jgi:hypothetical protein
MEVDKRIGQRLADKSAVRGDKSAPTVGLEVFVNRHNGGSYLMQARTGVSLQMVPI